jgi:6-phosphogluconate dehydrogenase (decarboxylating)
LRGGFSVVGLDTAAAAREAAERAGARVVASLGELGVPAPVITASLLQRLRSRSEGGFAERLLAALRRQFGGHAVEPAPRSDPGE